MGNKEVMIGDTVQLEVSDGPAIAHYETCVVIDINIYLGLDGLVHERYSYRSLITGNEYHEEKVRFIGDHEVIYGKKREKVESFFD